MRRQISVLILLGGLLAGCGASPKRIQNDEVSSPMSVTDKASLNPIDAGTADSSTSEIAQ